MTQINHLKNFSRNVALTPARMENPPAGGAKNGFHLISIIVGAVILHQHQCYVHVFTGRGRKTMPGSGFGFHSLKVRLIALIAALGAALFFYPVSKLTTRP